MRVLWRQLLLLLTSHSRDISAVLPFHYSANLSSIYSLSILVLKKGDGSVRINTPYWMLIFKMGGHPNFAHMFCQAQSGYVPRMCCIPILKARDATKDNFESGAYVILNSVGTYLDTMSGSRIYAILLCKHAKHTVTSIVAISEFVFEQGSDSSLMLSWVEEVNFFVRWNTSITDHSRSLWRENGMLCFLSYKGRLAKFNNETALNEKQILESNIFSINDVIEGT